MNQKALRDSWEAYAKAQGLIGSVPHSAFDAQPPKRAKYGNQRQQVDGHWFDSRKEAARYQELKLMQQAKQIADLELHPSFPLHVMRLYRSGPIEITTVGILKTDFRYTVLEGLNRGEIVIEDVKSDWTKTTAYQLRKRIAEAVHGITIVET